MHPVVVEGRRYLADVCGRFLIRSRLHFQNLADAYAKSVRLCEIGLEMNNDDPNATADWLLSEAAAAWIEDVADDEGPTSTASAPSVRRP